MKISVLGEDTNENCALGEDTNENTVSALGEYI
jgi:hypothetical protein